MSAFAPYPLPQGRWKSSLTAQAQPLEKTGDATFETFVPDVQAGARYHLLKDGTEMPDPASRFQPEGVHGPSEVINPHTYEWHDENWRGVAQQDLVFYELHVGTFTPGRHLPRRAGQALLP